jgi:hypothetical protein
METKRYEVRTERGRLLRSARTDRVWQRSSATYLLDDEAAKQRVHALDAWRSWALAQHVDGDNPAVAVRQDAD